MLDRNGIAFYYDDITEGGTPTNMKSTFDLGEKPVATVIKPKEQLTTEERKAADVMFLPPRPNLQLAVVTYSECSPELELRDDQIHEEVLRAHGLSTDTLLRTVGEVNRLLKPLRGTVARYDRYILFYLLFGLFVVSLLGVALGLLVHFGLSLALAVVYFMIFIGFVCYTKGKNATLVKEAHFVLAAYAKAENNRYYRRRGIYLRAGFMAKWVEIHF